MESLKCSLSPKKEKGRGLIMKIKFAMGAYKRGRRCKGSAPFLKNPVVSVLVSV